MDNKQRRELISRIEHKEYVTYDIPKYPLKNNGVLLLILGILYFVLWLAQKVLSSISIGENILGIVTKILDIYLYVALGIFVIFTVIWLAIYLKKRSRIYDLGRLSANDKKLILHGELIEADLDLVSDSEKGATVKCSANYNAQRLNFESPAIRAQVLPIENRKLSVFIEQNNPKNYLVNIYDHVPRKGPKVLSNREGLKFGERTDEDHWRRIVLSIVVAFLIIFCWPFLIGFMMLVLAPLVELIYALINNDMSALGGFAILLILEIAIVLYVRHKLRESGAIKRGSRAWRPSNYYLDVIIDKYWTTEYVVRGEDGKQKHKVYHISGTYIEPGTKYMYVFSTTGPQQIARLQGKEVRVYVKANNMEKYYIDYIAALQNNGVKYDSTGFTFDDNGVWYEK